MNNLSFSFLLKPVVLLLVASFLGGCSFAKIYEKNAPTDQTELTKEVQRLLVEKGFDPGSVDGNAGKKTLSALEAFQKSRGLPLTKGVNAEAFGQLMTLANNVDQPLSNDVLAKKARFISPEQTKKCTYIDQVSAIAELSFFGGMEATEEAANTMLKAKAAKLGANGVRVSDRLFDKGRGGYDKTRLTLYGDIYKCPNM